MLNKSEVTDVLTWVYVFITLRPLSQSSDAFANNHRHNHPGIFSSVEFTIYRRCRVEFRQFTRESLASLVYNVLGNLYFKT